MEFRCPNKKFGEVIEPGTGGIIEFKCTSNWCGANNGENVVFHRFEVDTQKLIDTRAFKNPNRSKLNALAKSKQSKDLR